VTGTTAQSSRRRIVTAGTVIAALLLVGALLSTTGSDAPDERTPATSRPKPGRSVVPTGIVGPAREEAGMPVGFAQGEHGAVAAGVAYATGSQRWLYFTDDQIRAAITQIATPASAHRLTENVLSDVGTARKHLGASPGRVWWLVRPLAWKAEIHGDNDARVSVWVVTILSAAKVAAPQTEWMTVTVDLAWVHGDWHVDAVDDVPGPTPMTGPKDRPWDAHPFDEALSGFTRLDEEPVS
jgi:hypothetical protein